VPRRFIAAELKATHSLIDDSRRESTMAVPTVSVDGHSIETEILDADMTRAELVFALRHLRFNRNDLSALKP
jgi:hypothetical protein